ncbi:serine hydrolase domain-containing protein [Dactylosporangium sucinum]|uniref:Esterase n=1 Tax=Dactylosporangium sucinum TaxID=1424081 RepID=A0A917WRL9_9ACTN|nr:serine hydrolase domain-containing protein [Dactylosporangium sucinum]GGM25624.1 esterase [Dactylosporangium sucinum]
MRDLLAEAPVPALALSVFDRERVLAEHVRGAAPDDWWDLASLTKVLVTLPEVLALCDAGRLGLDLRLGTQWPPAAGHPVAAATVRQLLSHDAGLPATRPYFRDGRPVAAAALAEPLDRPPGSGAVYSDLGYIILGRLVEDVTGRPLSALARDRTGLRFAPLPGPAVPTERCAWRGRLVRGEVHDENAAAMGGVAGHAGAFGTLSLVTRAVRDWFAGRVVSAGLHRQAVRGWSSNGSQEVYGLGWWLGGTRGTGGALTGPGAHGHTGFVGNLVWLAPHRDRGVVLLSNRVHPVRGDRAPFAAWCGRLLEAVARDDSL